MIRRQIPNLITLGNLLCGVLACAFAVKGIFPLAAMLICGGIFLDFFDGMSARLLGVASPLGKELDSLADIVTSGVAPSFILMGITGENPIGHWLSWMALLMPLFAAYRLAKFNIDTRQSHSFIGLPVPANALIWVGLAPYAGNPDMHTSAVVVTLIALSVVTDILMVSELPMFSLKVDFKDLSFKTNRVQYIYLIGCALIAIICREWYALSVIILWYILFSIITQRRPHAEQSA